MLLVVEPNGKDKDGNDICKAMLCSNMDINGLIPKWIVNLASKSAPKQWFVDCQAAVDLHKAGNFTPEKLAKPFVDVNAKKWFWFTYKIIQTN